MAALGTAAAGIVSFRAQSRAASEEFGLSLLSPLSLYTGFKGLVVEFSTFNEYLLLAVGLLLLLVTVVLGGARWREIRRETGLRATEPGRVAGWLVNQRTLAFFAVCVATVLGAYAYQQYLWRVALPIPDDAIGFAITREASAASFQDQLADTLYTQGQAQEVVIRELPVKFDATDTGSARELGDRIGAEAVIIYRVDETTDDGQREYIAYVVFTDPQVGLVVGGPTDGEPGGQGIVQVKEGLDVPVLRADTMEDLVNAAAGIIAYNEHRLRAAIEHLELAVPDQPDAANTGIVNFHLGNARNLDGQIAAARSAWEDAAAFYEARLQAGEGLGPQDALILVKTYIELGRSAAVEGDWDTALSWYERALKLREDLVARADGLERPSDVPATFARLFTMMSDAYRGKGMTEDQEYWRGRAAEELDSLEAGAAPDDPYPLVQGGAARVLIGDCDTAVDSLTQALTLDPENLDAYTNVGIVYLLQGRPDLAAESWRQIVALHPEDISARMLLANILVQQGIGQDYFEPLLFLEAEDLYREVIRLDPTNDAAHEEIAELAEIRAQGAMLDSTALVVGDDLSVEKSLVLWPQDEERRDQALAAYDLMIEMQRILASELRPGDPLAQAAVAAAYAERQGLNYGLLLSQPSPEEAEEPAETGTPAATPLAGGATPIAAGTPSAEEPTTVDLIGEDVLADAAQIREWTDKVLANPSASRMAQLEAWAARVRSFERVWAWYYIFDGDEAKATEAEEEYRAAIEEALAYGDGEPIGAIDEIAPLRLIYFSAQIFSSFLDGDSAAVADLDEKIEDLTTREMAERSEGIDHLTTYCTETQETDAGDIALDSGDEDAALEHYEAAIAANPDHALALLGAGRVLFAGDDLPGAIERAEAATRAAPDNPATWADLGLYRLAEGDSDAANAAYAQYFTVLGAQHPQQWMASVNTTLSGIESLLDDEPGVAPQVATVLPGFAGFLEGNAGTDSGSLQYPALYATVGTIALRAGAPAEAEAWLRTALELDPHLPAAHAALVLAVVAQDRDATAEIDGALAEANDPLWPSTTSYAPDQVLSMMEREAESLKEFAGDGQGLDDFLSALEDAQEELE